MSTRLLTLKELATVLRCSTRTIQRLVNEGMPRLHVIGRLYRYDLEAIRLWLAMKNQTQPEMVH